MSTQIQRVFAPNGLLAKEILGYRPRLQQIEMALAVGANAEHGGHLICEAPTGVGKSLGYLVPYLPFAIKGEKVVVVTSSIVLQEQIVNKDLPLLQRILPEPFDFALAKGLNNYACLNELEDFRGEVKMLGIRDPDVERQWPTVDQWTQKTATGDLSELPFELNGKIRLKVTTTSEDCLGRKCAHHDECFAMKARKAVRSAQVVVANYHLFFIDLTIKAGDPDAGPLPSYRHVVFDEGHDAPDIAREFFGFRVGPGAIRRAARFLNGNAKHDIPAMKDAHELARRLQAESDAFFEDVKEVAKRREYKGRLELAGAFDPTRLNVVLAEVSRAYADAVPSCSSTGAIMLASSMTRLGEIARQLEWAATMYEPSQFVYFIDDPVAVAMKPIEVGPMLKEHLFDRDDDETGKGVKSITITSATLATGSKDGEQFEYFQQEIGCHPADELMVGSPFDLANNALLYLPKVKVDPNNERFPDEVADVCWDVAQAAGGRTLCLFTSFRILRHVKQTFERRGAPWRLLAQGDAPKSQLVQQFKSDETSVLFGCESFWQGVDVPGPALSAVVIDKIPFPHMHDPVMGAVAAIDRNWFTSRAIPSAGIALKQGFGRLIRRQDDRGVVAICDPRLRTKGYGKKLLRLFPAGMKTTSDVDDVVGFFTDPAGIVASM